MTILFSGRKMCFIVQRKNTDIIKVFESDGIVITIEYKKYRHWLRENLAVDDDIFFAENGSFWWYFFQTGNYPTYPK